MDLDALLRLAWVAATLPILVASVPVPGLARFRGFVKEFSRRGKTFPNSSKRFTVPQSYFLHFYVVAVAWTTFLLAFTWFYAHEKMTSSAIKTLDYSTVVGQLTGGSNVFTIQKPVYTYVEHKRRVWSSIFILLLMEAQVLRRLFETLYVFDYSNSARMHVCGYLAGLYFYVAAPLSICSFVVPEILSYIGSRVAEFVIKGQQQLSLTDINWWEYVKPLTHLGWYEWIGAAIFMWGWIHQLLCHNILGSIRKQTGTDAYVVPYGDWFELVSCAHYLAEIVIYAGILLCSGGVNLTVWLVFVFVASNLIYAAGETHQWYQVKFENYPKTRRAILPMIY